MSDSPSSFSFPHRTPVFTAVVVILCFAAFGWLARRIYVPQASTVEPVAGVLTPVERKTLLAEQRTKEQAAATTYGWVDQSKGVVRLPIDRAIELTVRDLAKK
ncbi:MAG: hypothetical protein QG602_1829 [Verrucomicrobiota bacterium]|nr:hypothetical protein [Verrucomicrobiota bacterium]